MLRASFRFKRIVLAVVALVATAAESPAEQNADPWATMRGCLGVLDRFATCSSNKTFATFIEKWAAAEGAGQKASRKEIERRLRWWMRPTGRREQCAIWARRTGAREHVGEGSPLAKAAGTGAATCEDFGRTIDKDGWIPAGLVDARQE